MRLITEHPIASESHDHLYPRGTAWDNTHCPAFVEACKRLFPKPSLLDLGCAGGGLVKDFADAGLYSFGLEGSDYSKVNNRAEWATIPDRLFCCDVTKPFCVSLGPNLQTLFKIVTAWELLEHIHEKDLPAFFDNVKRHLESDGIFMASIALFPDSEGDKVWHVTLRQKEWWIETLKKNGLHPFDVGFAEKEWPRGSANGPGDWSGETAGFHVACRQY